MEASVERQKASIAAMKASLTARRPPTQAKAEQSAHSGFFLLPPLAGAVLPGAPLPAPRAECPPLAPSKVDELVTTAASAASVPPDLLRAVMREESAFRPCAVSGKGAMGLMQLMQSTAADLGVGNVFDPRENVTAGARFLRQLIDLYGGDLTLALSAYNAGPARVDQAGGVPPITETVNYVTRVLSALPVQ